MTTFLLVRWLMGYLIHLLLKEGTKKFSHPTIFPPLPQKKKIITLLTTHIQQSQWLLKISILQTNSDPFLTQANGRGWEYGCTLFQYIHLGRGSQVCDNLTNKVFVFQGEVFGPTIIPFIREYLRVLRMYMVFDINTT